MIVASATRCTASPYAAIRIDVLRSSHRRPRLVERAGDDLVQPRVDLVFLPEVLLQPLHPLEVGDDDTAGVREHVRQDEHAVRLENLVGGRRDRPVRTLDDQLRLHLVGVVRRDHLLERARRERVAVEHEQLLVRDPVAALQLAERPAAALVRERRRDVDAVRVVDAARRVGDGDDLRAFLGGELREVRADVAEALHRDARSRRATSPGSRAPSSGRRARRARSPPRARASRRSSAACR